MTATMAMVVRTNINTTVRSTKTMKVLIVKDNGSGDEEWQRRMEVSDNDNGSGGEE